MSDILGSPPPEDAGLPTNSGTVIVDLNNNPISRTERNTIEPQSIAGWKNFADQDIHIAVDDCFTGLGGFRGNFSHSGFYSYLVPRRAENFYGDRMAISTFFNLYAPHIRAKVDPTFSMGVQDKVKTNDEYAKKDKWLDYAEDCTGTGKSLNEMRKAASISAWNHGVSFVIVDKAYRPSMNTNFPFRYTRSVLDLDAYGVHDRTMMLDWISFWEVPEIVRDASKKPTGQIRYVKRVHGVEEGRGYVEMFKSKPVSGGSNKDDLEYSSEVKWFTGISRINVYAMFSQPEESGCYKPVLPLSYNVARICYMIYNCINLMSYVLFKQGHGLIAVQGNLTGAKDFLSSFITLPPDTEKQTYKMPTILSPDADLPRVHVEIIQKLIEWLIAIMGTNGVSMVEKKAESGVSKGFDYIATNQTNLENIEMNKRCDRWEYSIFDEFEGRTQGDYEYETLYPTDFYPEAGVEVIDLIEIANFFKGNGAEITSREIMKQLANSALPEITPETLVNINSEIMDLVFEEPDDSDVEIVDRGDQNGVD
jgi:hypothetical protein